MPTAATTESEMMIPVGGQKCRYGRAAKEMTTEARTSGGGNSPLTSTALMIAAGEKMEQQDETSGRMLCYRRCIDEGGRS